MNDQTLIPIFAVLIIGTAIARHRRAVTSAHDDARPESTDQTPLVATEDGLVKIWAITSSDPNAPLTLGDAWRIQAEGLRARVATASNPWVVQRIYGLLPTSDDPRTTLQVLFNYAANFKNVVGMCQAAPPPGLTPGTYPLILNIDLRQARGESGQTPVSTTLRVDLSVMVSRADSE